MARRVEKAAVNVPANTDLRREVLVPSANETNQSQEIQGRGVMERREPVLSDG